MQTFNDIQDTAFSINNSWSQKTKYTSSRSKYRTSGFLIYSDSDQEVFGSSTFDSLMSSSYSNVFSSSVRERGNHTSSTAAFHFLGSYESSSSSSKTHPGYTKTFTHSTRTDYPKFVVVSGTGWSGSGMLTSETDSRLITNGTTENLFYTNSQRVFDVVDPDNNTEYENTGVGYFDTRGPVISNGSAYSGIVSTSAGGTAFVKNTLSYTYEDTFSSISSDSLVSSTSVGTNTTMFNTTSTLNTQTLTTSIVTAQSQEKIGTEFIGAPGVLLMHLDFTKPNSAYSYNNIASHIKVAKSIKIVDTTHRNVSMVTTPANSLYTSTGYNGDDSYSYYLENDSQWGNLGGGQQEQKSELVASYDGIIYTSGKVSYVKTASTVKTIFNSGISDSESRSTTILDSTSAHSYTLLGRDFLSTASIGSGEYYSASENSITFLSTFLNREKINLKVNETKSLNNVNYLNVVTKSQTKNSNNISSFSATSFERSSSLESYDSFGSIETASSNRTYINERAAYPYKTSYFTRPRDYSPYEYGNAENAGRWIPPIPSPINLALDLNDFALTSIKNDYGHVSYLQNQKIGTDGSYYNKLEPTSFKISFAGGNYGTGDCTNHGFHAVTPVQQSSYFIARFLSTNDEGTLISYSTDFDRITLSYTDSDLESSALSSTLVKISQDQQNLNWGSSLIDGATRFTKNRGDIYYSEQSIRTSTNSNAYDTSGPESFQITAVGNKDELIITNDFGDIVPSNSKSNFIKTTSNNERTAFFNTVYNVDGNNRFGEIQNLFNLDYFTAGGILDNGENKSVTFINKVNPQLSQLKYSYYDRSNSSLVSGVSSFNRSFSTQGSKVTTYKPIGPSIHSSTEDQITYSTPFTLGENNNNSFPISIAGGSELTTVMRANNSSNVNRKMSPSFGAFNTVVIGEIKPNTDILGIGCASHLPSSSGQDVLPVGAFASSEKEAVFSTILGSNQKHALEADTIYAKTAAGADDITGPNWTTTGKMFGFDSKFGTKMY